MINASVKIECLWDGKAILGEGPVYSTRRHGLFWVDIKAQQIHFMDFANNSIVSHSMPEPIGWVHERENGGLICGLKNGFFFFDPDTSELEQSGNPEQDKPNNRLNDAKVDRFGAIWAGSMDDLETEPNGSLYRLSPDLTWKKCDEGYVVANGPAFSPDYKTLYHTSSSTREIFAFDLDSTNTLSNKRLHIKFSDEEGYPDGMTCDYRGGLWVAHWDGWRISRFHADGTLDQVIKMPIQRPTSICFGGKNLDEIYITSASINLSAEELLEQPQAGGLFRIKTGHVGMPQNLFAG